MKNTRHAYFGKTRKDNVTHNSEAFCSKLIYFSGKQEYNLEDYSFSQTTLEQVIFILCVQEIVTHFYRNLRFKWVTTSWTYSTASSSSSFTKVSPKVSTTSGLRIRVIHEGRIRNRIKFFLEGRIRVGRKKKLSLLSRIQVNSTRILNPGH